MEVKTFHELLRQHGIDPKFNGYWYLIDILSAIQKDPFAATNLSRCVYPDICAKYNIGKAGIDLALRRCIKAAGLNKTPGQFVAMLAAELSG